MRAVTAFCDKEDEEDACVGAALTCAVELEDEEDEEAVISSVAEDDEPLLECAAVVGTSCAGEWLSVAVWASVLLSVAAVLPVEECGGESVHATVEWSPALRTTVARSPVTGE